MRYKNDVLRGCVCYFNYRVAACVRKRELQLSVRTLPRFLRPDARIRSTLVVLSRMIVSSLKIRYSNLT